MASLQLWYNNILGSERELFAADGQQFHIGRRADNDVVLNSPFVAEEAATLTHVSGGWQLTAIGLNGCQVGARNVRAGETLLLSDREEFMVFPFKIEPQFSYSQHKSASPQAQLSDAASDLIQTVHIRLLSVMDLSANHDVENISDEYLLTLERNIEEIAEQNGLLASDNASLVKRIAGEHIRGCLVEKIIAKSNTKSNTKSTTKSNTKSNTKASDEQRDEKSVWNRFVSSVPEREEDLYRLLEHFWIILKVADQHDISEQMRILDQGYWNCWNDTASNLFWESVLYAAQRHLKKQIKDIVFGYGPLEDLLRTPTISEVMVVASDLIYIEKNGVIENSGRKFVSDDVTLTVIERIVSQVGRRIDRSKPLVDARLRDGSRVNAVIPPLAVSGPCLTIRRFPNDRLNTRDLIDLKTINETVDNFLRAAVCGRRNILISGSTGSGKTTLLNCLSDYIPDKERIVTVEDTAELQLQKTHVVRLETKQSNVEDVGAFTIHDLVKNALRMRPDRIVVGECRGPEALDMLQAMNTGHDGSLATVHANSAQEVISRLEVMVRSAAELPLESIHRQIVSAIDLVVQLKRCRDGTRRVTQISELRSAPHGIVETRDIFALEPTEAGEDLRPTGFLPTFMEELLATGLIDLDTFYR